MREHFKEWLPAYLVASVLGIVFAAAVISAHNQQRQRERRCEAALHSATAVDSVRVLIVAPDCLP